MGMKDKKTEKPQRGETLVFLFTQIFGWLHPFSAL